MDEVRAIAVALYKNGTPESRAALFDLFRSMDTDGSGTISKQEFTTYLDKKCPGLFRPEFFSLLDADGNGTLDFTETITFLYFSGYRAVWCDGCRSFFFGAYFTCASCFVESKRNRYDLCFNCFNKKDYKHEHTQFLDNYSMLNVFKAETESSGGSKTETSGGSIVRTSGGSNSRQTRRALEGLATAYSVSSTINSTISNVDSREELMGRSLEPIEIIRNALGMGCNAMSSSIACPRSMRKYYMTQVVVYKFDVF